MALIGIDLGTSFSSLAAIGGKGEAILIPNEHGSFATPSAVFIGQDGVSVGYDALKRARRDPSRLIQNAKRCLGMEGVGWEIDGVNYTPQQAATIILRQLLRDARRKVTRIDGAVITVPAHFDSLQRQLTREAAERAGWTVMGIVEEPVAAALRFILGKDLFLHKSGLAGEKTVFVFDLGGGTCDLSLVKYDEEQVRVVSAGGDLMLGGIDWSQRLFDLISTRCRQRLRSDAALSPEQEMEMASEVEDLKARLSGDSPTAQFSMTVGAKPIAFDVTRGEFEERTKDLILRSRRLMKSILKNTNHTWGQIDHVLVVGGASRMPMIQQLINFVTGKEPQPGLSPEYAVAEGAALHAAASFSGGINSVSTRSVTLATTRDLVLMVHNARKKLVPHVVIPANSSVPAATRVRVVPFRNGQKRIHLRFAEVNRAGQHGCIGHCVLEAAGEFFDTSARFVISLEYRPDGQLHVVVKENDNGGIAAATLDFTGVLGDHVSPDGSEVGSVRS